MNYYNKFSTSVSAKGEQPNSAFDALCDLSATIVGHKLFTVMTFDQDSGEACRIYTNAPDAYPTSGKKPPNETDWTRIVLEQHQTFVANDLSAIADVFYDHELIGALGCASVINVPIIISGRVMGTINCLHEQGYFTKTRVDASEELKLPGAVCLLMQLAIEKGDMKW